MRVTVNGCFNNLHPGHLFYLGFARAQGDELIVGINSSAYIRRVKQYEPQPEDARIAAILALNCVHSVHVFEEDTAVAFLMRVRPDVHCIGEEYRGVCSEEDWCGAYGVRVVYIPRVGEWSTRRALVAQQRS